MVGIRRRMTVACSLVALLAVASACSSDDLDGSAESTTTTLAENASLEQISAALGCTSTIKMGDLVFPIRGRAATAGVACDMPSGSLHLFARAPAGDPEQPGAGMGGLTQNIDRVLMTNEAPDPRCPAEVVIGESYFAVSDSPDSLAILERIAGHVERSASPTAPMTSYLAWPCHTGLDPLGIP